MAVQHLTISEPRGPKPSHMSQRSILHWADGCFGQERQTQSEKLLARLQVSSSVAFIVLSNADMTAFC